MYQVANRIVFAAALMRILGAAAVAGAIGYGLYLGYHGAIVTGLVWVVSAVTAAVVGETLFGLVRVLASAAVGPSEETSIPVVRSVNRHRNARRAAR